MKVFYIIVALLLLGLAYGLGRNQTQTNSIPNGKPTEKGLCTRTSPYDAPSEIKRALSLLSERWDAEPNAPTPKGGMSNCLHIIYKDHSEMDNAEGYFLFDKSSNPNDIRIFIDNTYKNYDDILTASLLKHEVIHATIYYLVLEGSMQPLTCVENEVDAFSEQIIFLTNLNPEEWKSITYRVASNPHLNSAYELTDFLLRLNKKGDEQCVNASDSNCWRNYVKASLTNWVKTNPYYQEQCGLTN